MFNDGQHQNPDLASFSQRYGLHPLVAGGMFALDHMLFYGLEVPSMGLLAVFSAFVGLLAVAPCALIQRHCHHDSVGAAWGKAMLAGLILAVPSPIPSGFTGILGVMGVVAAAQRARIRTVRSDERDNDSTHNN